MGKPIPYSIPLFDSVEDERTYVKQRLAAGLRIFGSLGFDEGIAGHITARDPQRPDCFWVNPFAMAFSQVRVSDLVLVDHSGEVLEGEWAVNPAAFCIHSQIHAARPDVMSAAHAHSIHGKAFSALGQPLAPITQDACAFYGDHALFDDYTGVVVEAEEGKRIAHALGGGKAAILRNHGLLTVGASVDEAVWWFVAAERSCHAQLLAQAAGPVVPIPHDQAQRTAGEVGDPFTGWLSFQSMYEVIVRLQPDLLD